MARKQITFENFAHMEVDEQTGELFWKGAAVATHRVVRLRHHEFALAVIAALASLLAAVHPFEQSFGFWH